LDIALHIQACRACQTAGCLIGLLYGKCPWNGLGVFLVSGLSGHETLVVFARQDYRADLGTVAAGRAFVGIYVSWILADSYLKIPWRSLYFFDFRAGDKIDVEMPADLDQFGRDDSHGAIICGKRLVQLGHHPADCRGLLHEVNQITGIGQIKRSLHSSDATTNNHDRAHGFVWHNGLLVISEIRMIF